MGSLEDPFRVTVESYVRIQAEKERKFHAIRENIDQLQGQLDMTDARWLEAMKFFSSVAFNGEYNAHRLFQFIARHVPSPAIRFAAFTQSVDELRHVQNEVLLFNNYNKYFQGFHDWKKLRPSPLVNVCCKIFLRRCTVCRAIRSSRSDCFRI